MSLLSTTELYNKLTFDELATLIRQIVFDKDLAHRAVLQLPETVNIFLVLNHKFIRVTVNYWNEPELGYTYGVTGAVFYPDRETFLFYESLYDKEEVLKRLN